MNGGSTTSGTLTKLEENTLYTITVQATTSYNRMSVNSNEVSVRTYVTGFGKTDHIVTIDISRNTDLKYRSRHGSLVLDCSHARFAV